MASETKQLRLVEVSARKETIYETAKHYLGVAEVPGVAANQQIRQFFEASGHPEVKDDETPWCAAFVGAVLSFCGERQTGSLRARSYENWGSEASLGTAERGDVVVLWRKSPTGTAGHVAFFHSLSDDGETVELLGGNQGNAVSYSNYPVKRVLSVRTIAPRRSAHQSKTLAASGVSLASVPAAATAIAPVFTSLSQTVQLALLASAVLLTVSLIVILRERVKKWIQGDQ